MKMGSERRHDHDRKKVLYPMAMSWRRGSKRNPLDLLLFPKDFHGWDLLSEIWLPTVTARKRMEEAHKCLFFYFYFFRLWQTRASLHTRSGPAWCLFVHFFIVLPWHWGVSPSEFGFFLLNPQAVPRLPGRFFAPILASIILLLFSPQLRSILESLIRTHCLFIG